MDIRLLPNEQIFKLTHEEIFGTLKPDELGFLNPYYEGETIKCTNQELGEIEVPIPTKAQQREIVLMLGERDGSAIVLVEEFYGWPLLMVNACRHKHTIYYLNLYTLQPTKKSPVRMELPSHIKDDLLMRRNAL